MLHAPPSSVSATECKCSQIGGSVLRTQPTAPSVMPILVMGTSEHPLATVCPSALCASHVCSIESLGHGHFPGGTCGFVRDLGDLSKVSQLLRGQSWDWARSDSRNCASNHWVTWTASVQVGHLLKVSNQLRAFGIHFSFLFTLQCIVQAFHCSGFSCFGLRLYSARAQYLWHTGLVAPRHVGSSQTRDRTPVPCIGRWILNHWAPRNYPICYSDFRIS